MLIAQLGADEDDSATLVFSHKSVFHDPKGTVSRQPRSARVRSALQRRRYHTGRLARVLCDGAEGWVLSCDFSLTCKEMGLPFSARKKIIAALHPELLLN